MLFLACFISYINFRLISNAISTFFTFPLILTYNFSIPLCNLLILLFSSLPIQASQIFIKIGFLHTVIEGIAHSLMFGYVFLALQFKEFLYSYYSITDCMIGSIFYFTTGLHGFHVTIGSFLFYIILYYLTLSYLSIYCLEFSYSLLFSGYH